jgi:hypothetical protein
MRWYSQPFSGFMPGLIALLYCFSWPLPVTAQEQNVFILSSSEWNVPRTTETILAMPALQKTIQAYRISREGQIQIRYPGGDEGTLWANELRSWLVALGIASKHIDLLPGSRDPGQLELEVHELPATARQGSH